MWAAQILTESEKIFLHPEKVTQKAIDEDIVRRGYNPIYLNPKAVYTNRISKIKNINTWINYFTGNASNSFPVFRAADGHAYALVRGQTYNWKMKVSFSAPGMPELCMEKVEKGAIADPYIGSGHFTCCNSGLFGL